MTTDTMKSYKERLADAIQYWIEKGESPMDARQLAQEQIDWEDEESNELTRWKGSNDSFPIFL